MNSFRRKKASEIRQDISNLLVQMGSLLEEIQRRDPLVKGTRYERLRRCGRQGCRCERGHLHISEAFSYSEDGKTKHVALARIDQDRLGQCVERYRRFRAARAELGKTWRALLERVDEMESVRRIPFEALLESRRSKRIVRSKQA